MSGAVSFVLGLLGLGASGAVNAKNGIEQMKKQAGKDCEYILGIFQETGFTNIIFFRYQ